MVERATSNIIEIHSGFGANGQRTTGITEYISLDASKSIECPFCHKIIDLSPLSFIVFSRENVQLFLKCTACRNLFIGYTNYDSSRNLYSITKLSKGTIKQVEYSNEITSLSPDFVDIYNQSNFAEHEGLTLICGVGYRKSLEFLIKDYLISEQPNKKSEIEKKLLGACITDYIDNPKIKEISKRATWIGNDETHYIKKWGDKDLSDLKKLIDITASYISSEILSKEYINNMSDNKKEE